MRGARILLMPLFLALACGDDSGSTSSSSTGTDGTTSDDGGSTTEPGTAGSDGSSETGTGGGPPTDDLDCPAPAAAPAGGYEVPMNGGSLAPQLNRTFDPLNPSAGYQAACGDLGMGLELLLTRVVLYHPYTGMNPATWPSGQFPVAVFHHGAGQVPDRYDALFAPLIEDGFVVVSLDSSGTIHDSEMVATSITCALRMLAIDDADVLWEHPDKLSCRAALLGHSAGGQGATHAVSMVQADPVAGKFDARALVAIAGSASLSAFPAVEVAVPALFLGTSTDEDVPGQAVRLYDKYVPEPQGQTNAAPKFLMWIHDLPHNAFGGWEDPTALSMAQGARSGLTWSEYVEKGETIAATYPRAFLRWHVLGLDEEDHRRVFTGNTFPPEVVVDAWWDYLPGFDEQPDGVTCSNLTASACEETRGCALDESSACHNAPVILFSRTVDTRPIDAYRVFIDDLEGAQRFDTTFTGPGFADGYEVGDAVTLVVGDVELMGADTRTYFGTGHETGALRTRWAGGTSADEVRWSLEQLWKGPANVSEHTALSLRVGYRSSVTGTTSAGDCEVLGTDVGRFAVELLSGENGAVATAEILSRPVIQQDAMWVRKVQGVEFCAAYFAMETMTFPLSAFWSQQTGLASDDIRELAIRFPGSTDASELIFDTVELVAAPDEGDGQYLAPGRWKCVAGPGLTATETSCDSEPVFGTCSPVVQNSVSLPTVPSAWAGGSSFTGWVIHAPASLVADPTDPSTAEVTLLKERCAKACSRHWAKQPEISASCTASNFTTPSFITTDSVGPVRAIPEDREDGSGIFMSQSLACDLEDSCCENFDENLCWLTAAERVTPAQYPVGFGEEYVVTVDSTVSAVSTEGDSAALTGTVGFSFCLEGNASGPCPFYLGSVSLQASGDVDVELDCPGGAQILTIEDLEIRLVQPAFGIDEEDTSTKGFPPGALVFAGTFSVDEIEMALLGPNEVDVLVDADELEFETYDLEVRGYAACTTGESASIAGTFDLFLDVRGDRQEQKPSISITMPDEVLCTGGNVNLTANASDNDNDLESVRFWVDDVLIEASTTAIPFTEPHVVRAVARDARGAAATATKTVGCVPL